MNQRVEEILSNPVAGIQPDISAGRTLAQAMEYFSFCLAGTNQAYPLDNMPVYQALHGVPATADDVEADLRGLRIPLEMWASPVRDDAGNVESAVVAFQDITRRRQAEAELADYRARLESLVAERTTQLSAANEQLHHEISERRFLEEIQVKRIKWLSALNQVRHTLSGTADVRQADEKLFATILQLLDAGAVFLIRWDGRGEQFAGMYDSPRVGSAPDFAVLGASFQEGSALRATIASGQSVCLSADQGTMLPAPLEECFRGTEARSLLLAPMITGQSVAGVIGVATLQPVEEVNPLEVDLVEMFGRHLGDLAQDAYLLDQAHALAAAEERNRLARDLHDSVTQMLFSAVLVAEVLPKIWRRDPARGLESLERLRQLTHGALAEMRTMLLELRPAALVNTPLGELLAQLTEAVANRTGLSFQLSLDRIPALPEAVHISFYRVAQEALNNVVKHAQASLVTVSLSAMALSLEPGAAERNEIRMVIQDDGVGYAAAQVQEGRLGIGIMRERAAAVQATLILEGRPADGSRVTLTWCDKSGGDHE